MERQTGLGSNSPRKTSGWKPASPHWPSNDRYNVVLKCQVCGWDLLPSWKLSSHEEFEELFKIHLKSGPVANCSQCGSLSAYSQHFIWYCVGYRNGLQGWIDSGEDRRPVSSIYFEEQTESRGVLDFSTPEEDQAQSGTLTTTGDQSSCNTSVDTRELICSQEVQTETAVYTWTTQYGENLFDFSLNEVPEHLLYTI